MKLGACIGVVAKGWILFPLLRLSSSGIGPAYPAIVLFCLHVSSLNSINIYSQQPDTNQVYKLAELINNFSITWDIVLLGKYLTFETRLILKK
jgi:hypothetical protein